MRKKVFSTLLLLGLFTVASCSNDKASKTSINSSEPTSESKGSAQSGSDVSSTTEKNKLEADEIYLSNLSCGGVIKDMTDFSQYNDTNRYRQVSTARDFLDALKDAKIEYTTEIVNGEVIQNVTKEATVNVIEITQDLDLGYNVISKAIDNLEDYDVLDWFDHKYDEAGVFIDPYISESGISQIKIENMSNLLIYSKNGSKIKHAGFKVTSCYNLAIRNLDFDEIWMWEDTSSATPSFNIGDYDNQAWAYFKIAYSENIWIDHCSFGKSYDGQIDVSNANSLSLPNRIPYGSKVLGGGVHISYCSFTSGTDEDGNIRDYITELYNNLENEYQIYKANTSSYSFDKTYSCQYYFKARDLGASAEDMLYGVIIPQKKGFLLGDTGNTYTQNKVLPQDEYFQPNTTYYKISGYEADGREKYKAEGYTVGEKISETTYTVNGQTLNVWYEGQNIVGNDYYYNLNLKVSFSSCRFRGIEDRLPNMRSGICYMYNSIIDNQEYYEHRNNIYGLKDQMKNANSKFKLALVSQCIVPCFNAGVYYDNVKIIGVQDLVKNNNILFEGKYDKDGNPMDQYDYSGYMFKQCYFLNDLDFKNSKRVTGSTSYDSTTDTVVDPFSSYNKTTAYASPKYFNYHNDNELDFEIIGYCNDYLPKSKFKDDETYIQEPEKLLYTMEKNYFNVYNSGTTSELYENFFLDIDYR